MVLSEGFSQPGSCSPHVFAGKVARLFGKGKKVPYFSAYDLNEKTLSMGTQMVKIAEGFDGRDGLSPGSG